MKRYTHDEIEEVKRLHRMWKAGEEGGLRADLSGSDLSGSDLSGSDLSGSNLYRANLYGVEITAIRAFSGLYEYQCKTAISMEGVPWIGMGCLWKRLEDWDRIGIRKSNIRDFPDDGSEKSERRVRAFNYVRAEVLVMLDEFKKKMETPKP